MTLLRSRPVDRIRFREQLVLSDRANFPAGCILERDKNAPDWPAQLQPFLDNGRIERLAPDVVIPLGTQIDVVTAKDFAAWAYVPPPAPRPELLDEADLLRLMKWLPAQLQEAATIGFPNPAVIKETKNVLTQKTVRVRLWDRAQIQSWETRIRALLHV